MKKETKIEIFFWLVALFVFSPRILLEVYEHKLKNSLIPFENNEWTVKDKDGNILYENLTLPYDLRWKEQKTNRREWIFEKTVNTEQIRNIEDLGIVLGRVGDSDYVLFNNCLIGSTALNLKTKQKDNWGWSFLRAYKIPIECVIYPSSVIKYHIYKWAGPGYGVIGGPFGFSKYVNIRSFIYIIDTLRYGVEFAFGIGLIFFISIQYLFIRLVSQKRESYGTFSLLSASVGLFLIMTSVYPFKMFDNDIFLAILLFSSASGAAIFFLKFFNQKFHLDATKLLNIFTAITLIMLVMCLFQKSFDSAYQIYEIWHPIFLIFFLLFFIKSLKLIREKRNSYYSKYIIGYAIFVISCVHDVIITIYGTGGGYLVGFGFPFFVIVIALYLSREYSDAFSKVEDQVIKRTRELNASLIDVQTLQIKKDEQARSFAHDIRSPLVALQVLKDIVSKDLSDDQKSLLKHTIIRINDLANTILPKNSDQEETNSKKASVFLWTLFDKLISEKRIEYQYLQNCQFELKNTSSIFDMHVFCVEVELTRILSNMINNSVEARIDDSMLIVRLNCEKKNNVIEISVTDNGKGIPEDSVHKIFQPGYSEGKKHGTGLGLTNAKKSIESWNGTIELCSTGITGTIFTIKLPIANKAPWLASSIDLSKIANLVIIDDQSYVIDTWKQKIKSLNKSFHVYWIQNMDDWIKNPLNDLPKEETLFLVDQDLSSNKTGLDMIEHLNLTKCSILVTANEDDIKLRQKVVFMGLSILPKSLIHEIPLKT